MPHLQSDAAPLSPYRIVWELMQAVDRTRTVVTHDAGHPRDQIVPFYETLSCRAATWAGASRPSSAPASAWRMGAKLARPDWLSVNIMGDAAFGMVGMDFETAVRARLPILTIVMNNGLMGGYGEWMPDAVERDAAEPPGRRLRRRRARRWAATPSASSGPPSCAPRSSRCIASTQSGQAALLEVMTHEEPELATG